MKYLVSLSVTSTASPDAFVASRAPSARMLWDLYLNDVIREMYARADNQGVIFIAEAPDAETVRGLLETLPIVQSGQVAGEVIGLAPFPDIALAFQA